MMSDQLLREILVSPKKERKGEREILTKGFGQKFWKFSPKIPSCVSLEMVFG